MEETRPRFIKELLVAAFIAGSLDIIAAWMIAAFYGSSPIGVLRFIASAAFGPVAFTGSASFALAGLVFHYLIAFCWTALFFLVADRLTRMPFSVSVVVGLLHGIIIWCIMNLLVLPQTRIPSPHFTVHGVLTGMIALMVMVGMPVAIMARKYYQGKDSRS